MQMWISDKAKNNIFEIVIAENLYFVRNDIIDVFVYGMDTIHVICRHFINGVHVGHEVQHKSFKTAVYRPILKFIQVVLFIRYSDICLHDRHLAEYECQTTYLEYVRIEQYVWIPKTTGTIS